MNRRRYLLFVFVLVLVATAIVGVWYWFAKEPLDDRAEPPSTDTSSPAATGPAAQAAPVQAPETDAPEAGAPQPFNLTDEAHSAIANVEASLIAGADNPRTLLTQLASYLLALDPATSSAAIRDYLASGRDAATGLPFAVGPNGTLGTLPSLRTVLMDLLASIDPDEALRQAETVFDAKTSADEYAVSLRNVGIIDTSEDGRAYVGERARELLANAEWADHPTAGFAEAFDAVVYAGDLQALPLLSQYAGPEAGRALNHPAFMTIDRLTLGNTDRTLSALSGDSTLLSDRPLTKAGLFARADPSDPEQRALAESYLAAQQPGSEAAAYFLKIFPNQNRILSNNLLSDAGSDTPTNAEVVQRLRDALDTVRQWQDDPRFAGFDDELSAAEQRLREQLGE